MRRRLAIQLIASGVLVNPAWAVDTRPATLLDSYTWRHSADWFGGFSALHLTDGGRQLLALSDRSVLVSARIDRDADGISGITIQDHWPLLSSSQQKLSGRAGDSEGIAVTSDGGFYVSFEGVHRIAYYARPRTEARVLPRPREFEQLDGNGSFEGLAINSKGRLYTLTEKTRTARGAIPVYCWDGRAWTLPFTLPERDGFQPVAADFGPDGRFYVLERKVALIGFRTRLRRWTINDDTHGAEEVLIDSGTGTHDNLEGLCVWRDANKRLIATMISDDNFLALQRTELVEYLLPD